MMDSEVDPSLRISTNHIMIGNIHLSHRKQFSKFIVNF